MKPKFQVITSLFAILTVLLSVLAVPVSAASTVGSTTLATSTQRAANTITATAVCTSTISGRVTASNTSAALKDARVRATLIDGSFSKTAITDAAGNYSITGLPAGSYKVFFEPSFTDEATYIGEYYNNQQNNAAANTVTVAEGGAATGIDAALDLGGRISGTVTGQGGVGLEDVSVTIYSSTGSIVTNTFTDENGAFTTREALPSGSYKVEFDPASFGIAAAYLGEFYNDKASLATADLVTVTAPNTTANINAQLSLGGLISGKVTGDGGVGLPDVDVVVYNADGTPVASALTNDAGDYVVEEGLPSGNYKVGFETPSTGVAAEYIGEFYNDKATEETANLVAVTAPNTTANINAQLARGGRISGTVTGDGGAGLTGVLVLIYNSQNENIANTTTTTGGVYTTPGLPSGNYRIQYFPVSFGATTGYLSEFYNDKLSLSTADAVAVTAPNTTANINAQLARGGRISGKATAPQSVDRCGNPRNTTVTVTIYDSNGNIVDITATDDKGDYTSNYLRSGTYKVKFEGTNLGTTFYNGKSSLADATPVTVTAPSDTAGINATLVVKILIRLPMIAR